MKIENIFSKFLLIFALAFGVAACDSVSDGTDAGMDGTDGTDGTDGSGGSDGSDGSGSGDEPGTGEPGEMLSADEQKAELERIALDFMSYAVVDEFQSTADAIEELIDLLEDADEFPEDLIDQMDAFIDMLDADNISSITDYISPSNGNYFDYTAYYGVYTYDQATGGWSKVDSSSQLQFNVDDYILNITASGKATIDSGKSEGEVPTLTNITFTDSDGVKLLDFTLKVSEIDYTAQTLVTEMTLEYLTFTISVSETIKNKTGEITFSLTKGSTTLITTTASATDLSFELADDDDLEDYSVKNIKLNANILNSLYITGTFDDVKAFIEAEDALDDEYWDWYNGRQEGYYSGYAELLNSSISASWNFDNSSVAAGTLEFDYEWIDYADYYGGGNIVTLLVFAEDGSKYDVEDYFIESAFQSTVDSAENLFDDFEDLFTF